MNKEETVGTRCFFCLKKFNNGIECRNSTAGRVVLEGGQPFKGATEEAQTHRIGNCVVYQEYLPDSQNCLIPHKNYYRLLGILR
jgi:hypothetical protein